jgi:hypothetical protein
VAAGSDICGAGVGGGTASLDSQLPPQEGVLMGGDTGDKSFITEELFGDPEWDLIGLVCDQLDRANPDLPIEACQAIARDIIKLVRERP